MMQNRTKRRIGVPEILAPAGSMESLKAAVAAGLCIWEGPSLVPEHMLRIRKRMKWWQRYDIATCTE